MISLQFTPSDIWLINEHIFLYEVFNAAADASVTNNGGVNEWMNKWTVVYIAV